METIEGYDSVVLYKLRSCDVNDDDESYFATSKQIFCHCTKLKYANDINYFNEFQR